MRFDPNTVDESAADFPCLQPGTHRVMCEGALLKPTKDGRGKLVAAKFVGLDGADKGINVFHNFNVQNANPTAQNIGQAELKKFLAAVGVTRAIDLDTELPRATANRVLYVETVLGEYQGRKQANIKSFAPTPQQQAHAQGRGFVPGEQRAQAPQPGSNLDDIPF